METEKSRDRLEVLERIKEYEEKGMFTTDVEQDPPTIPLTPDKVDYLNKKLSSKFWMKFANHLARGHINKLIKNKQLIIKEVTGIENYIAIKNTGTIITCNHFNAFDNFAVYKAIEKHLKHRELKKVCREGNFTNFPGFYGFLFRHCNTLPLSQNPSTMKKFMEAVRVYLERGEQILIYPEQAMWWNYRKPRPLASGAFRFAAMHNAPVLPMFITMTDSDIIAPDGFPVQEYTIHILPAIWPKDELSVKQNAEYLKEENYRVWREVYEKTYGVPLTYTTKTQEA